MVVYSIRVNVSIYHTDIYPRVNQKFIPIFVRSSLLCVYHVTKAVQVVGGICCICCTYRLRISSLRVYVKSRIDERV